MDDGAVNVVALLRGLVAARSPSHEEGPAADLMERWCRDVSVGGEINAASAEVVRSGHNVAMVRAGGATGPTLLLCSHHDTVPATPSWTRPPWVPTVEHGRLYGLGANDAKGCVAAMAMACATARVNRGRLIFASVCEEEVGRGGLEAFLPLLPAPDMAIIGEPTGMNIATAQNGLLVLDCRNAGRAGHAARPQLADNPISAMARDILAVEGLLLERLHPVGGRTTCVVTVARAGDRHNVIPDHATWTIDLRTTAAYTHGELVTLIASQIGATVVVRSDRFRPVATPADAAILTAARRAFPAALEFSSPTLSDWAHLAHVPAIKWGPGLSEVSHTADEWVDLAMVDAAVTAYRSAIEAVLA